MATIKSYSDINQSKKLAEILPLESADMWWLYVTAQGKYIAMMHDEPDPHYLARMESYGIKDAAIRCWSLAALLDVLPEGVVEHYYAPNIQKENGKYSIAYGNEKLLCVADNPIDACYEMILKLNELKML